MGIWSLKASEEVPKLRCALELLQKLAEMYTLRPPFQKLRFRGSGMGLGILTYEIPRWDRWRLCVGQTSRTAGLETPVTFSYQCHSALVMHLERMGIFFPDAGHKHVGLNKPVSALVMRLVGRGIHCPPLPSSLGSHSVDWIEFVCGTKPKGREGLSIQLIFVSPSIWCLKSFVGNVALPCKGQCLGLRTCFRCGLTSTAHFRGKCFM